MTQVFGSTRVNKDLIEFLTWKHVPHVSKMDEILGYSIGIVVWVPWSVWLDLTFSTRVTGLLVSWYSQVTSHTITTNTMLNHFNQQYPIYRNGVSIGISYKCEVLGVGNWRNFVDVVYVITLTDLLWRATYFLCPISVIILGCMSLASTLKLCFLRIFNGAFDVIQGCKRWICRALIIL